MPRWTIKRTHATSSTRWVQPCAHHQEHIGRPIVTTMGAPQRHRVHHWALHRLSGRYSVHGWPSGALHGAHSGHPIVIPSSTGCINIDTRCARTRHIVQTDSAVPEDSHDELFTERILATPSLIDRVCTTSKIVPTEREIVRGSILPPPTPLS